MEGLGDILKRLDMQNVPVDSKGGIEPDSENMPADLCRICLGRGWFTNDVPIGHSSFGKAIICECQERRLEQEQSSRLLQYSNLGSLARFTFGKWDLQGKSGSSDTHKSFHDTYEVLKQYSEHPEGWIVLSGPHGSGKTHLAAAIGNRCIERGHVVFFSHVPDLLDHLRAAFGPDGDDSYGELFEQVRNVPLLILDGLGDHSTTPWAEEKLRQIINDRYNSESPTVFTTALSLDELDSSISSRLKTSGLSRVIELGGHSRKSSDTLGQIPVQMLGSMTLGKFDIRGNNPNDAQRRSLEYAYKLAENYSADPHGWLTLFGETGAGKTHLAVAIAEKRLEEGHPVFFIMVSDLLDHLRATFEPSSGANYDQRFEEIKNIPLLILDDLGRERSSPWADEKLHQIIVHRHNTRLPTVITTMIDFTRSEEQGPIGSRIQDPSSGELIRLDAPDYRNKQRSPKRARRTSSKSGSML